MAHDETIIEVLAPAKLNLFLHITGKRDDGFHFLESLFVYCDFGDRLKISSASDFELEISGPFGPVLAELCPDNNDNLILKAARKLAGYAEEKGMDICPVHIALQKNIPVAAGVGGGSADAAAVLGGLIEFWGLDVSDDDLHKIALELGADVTASLSFGPKWVTGIGEVISPLEAIPSFYVVLVNPCVPLSTPSVFKAYSESDPIFENERGAQTNFGSLESLLEFLGQSKNQLENVAVGLESEIDEVLNSLLNQSDCQLARMSGSGPTCFGIFTDLITAEKALDEIETSHPDWWVEVANVLGK